MANENNQQRTTWYSWVQKAELHFIPVIMDKSPNHKIYTYRAKDNHLNIDKANYFTFEEEPHTWEQRLWT